MENKEVAHVPNPLSVAIYEDDIQRQNTVEGTITPIIDIEHFPVHDDPRHWSYIRKHFCLFLISSAAMMAGMAGNVQNPAVKVMETELPATSQQFSLSIALFILVQGSVPLIWCAISEIKGRKLVYLVSQAFFAVACIAVALSTNIGLVIAFRAIQAAGSSAVMSVGAATLADIFDPAERGTKMGIYYIAPLLGPALGPIVGGALTTALGWRSIFWFLAILAGFSCVVFLVFFRDTFRKERSLTYQNVLKQRLRQKRSSSDEVASPSKSIPESLTTVHHADLEGAEKSDPSVSADQLGQDVELSLKDVNPFRPIGIVLRRINNLAILFASGFMFALTYIITYTSARTLSKAYHYDALMIGVVTLTYGTGCIFGSLLGGRWSDYKLAKLKEENGGKSFPEMRLRSTTLGIIFLPPCIMGFGWACERRVHIAVLCVLLFASGFFTIWTYASTLAYIVDANVGRSATAVSSNSAFRGFFAFIATEIAVPLQDNIGEGWLYTFWGFMMVVSGGLTLLVIWKGEVWRASAEKRELLGVTKENSRD